MSTKVSPVSRQIILSRKISRVIRCYSERYGVSLEEALDTYYTSVTARLIEEGVADMHCFSDGYLADELWKEVSEREGVRKEEGE